MPPLRASQRSRSSLTFWLRSRSSAAPRATSACRSSSRRAEISANNSWRASGVLTPRSCSALLTLSSSDIRDRVPAFLRGIRFLISDPGIILVCLQGRLYPGCELGKSRLIERSHLSERFAIEIQAQFFHSMNKLAVGKLVLARRGANPHDPETAKVPFLAPAVAIGITPRAIRGLFHEFVKLALFEEITFGELGELLALGAAHSSALDSWHGFTPFREFRGSKGTLPLALPHP